MKPVIFYTTLLSLLIASNAWFLDFKSGKKDKWGKSDKSDKSQPAVGGRKVVLVARKCYIPMYTTGRADVPFADQLEPLASGIVTADGKVVGSTLQSPPIDMGSSDFRVNPALVAPVPVSAPEAFARQFVYPVGYGFDPVYGAPYGYDATGPQYVQYMQPEVMPGQYGAEEVVPAEPYAPTDYTETTKTDEPTTEAADVAYTPA